MFGLIKIFFRFYNRFFSPDKTFAKRLRSLVGFTPSNLGIFKLAFYHKSASSEKLYAVQSNERLEYLGDAVLGTIVAEYLFKKYPNKDEGFLTKMRSKIVKRQSLNKIADKMGLDVFLSQYNNTRLSRSMLGNALEALVGAVYIECGYQKTRHYVIQKILRGYLDIHELESFDDNYKSQLLEWCQKNGQTVSYKMLAKYKFEKRDRFKVAVLIDGKKLAVADDFNKKSAEQTASEKAMQLLGLLKDNDKEEEGNRSNKPRRSKNTRPNANAKKEGRGENNRNKRSNSRKNDAAAKPKSQGDGRGKSNDKGNSNTNKEQKDGEQKSNPQNRRRSSNQNNPQNNQQNSQQGNRPGNQQNKSRQQKQETEGKPENKPATKSNNKPTGRGRGNANRSKPEPKTKEEVAPPQAEQNQVTTENKENKENNVENGSTTNKSNSNSTNTTGGRSNNRRIQKKPKSEPQKEVGTDRDEVVEAKEKEAKPPRRNNRRGRGAAKAPVTPDITNEDSVEIEVPIDLAKEVAKPKKDKPISVNPSDGPKEE